MKHRQFALAFAFLCFGSATQAQDAKAAAKTGESDKPLYTVVDGYKVDEDTLKGFKTWRAAACDRCHGANQEGMVGPSLIERGNDELTDLARHINNLASALDRGGREQQPVVQGNQGVSPVGGGFEW